MPAPYDQLFAHLIWADDRILSSLRAAPAVDPAAIKLMAHVLGAERVWIDRIEQVEPPPPVWPALDLVECARLAETVHGRYRRLLSTIDDAALARIVQYRNSKATEFSTPLSDILLHVTQHGTYHRGQIAALIRASGIAPNPTDYIAFVR